MPQKMFWEVMKRSAIIDRQDGTSKRPVGTQRFFQSDQLSISKLSSAPESTRNGGRAPVLATSWADSCFGIMDQL
jgi:hypothetical protein